MAPEGAWTKGSLAQAPGQVENRQGLEHEGSGKGGNRGARQHHQAKLTSPPPWLCPGSPGSCPATSEAFRTSNVRGSDELFVAPCGRDEER